MKSKLFGLIISGLVVIAILVSVGGWLDNEDGGKEDNPGDEGSTPIVETVDDVKPLTEFNTDTLFENITIEIEDYFGKYMIYKVTNNSNVCYKYLSGTTYFKSDPLPGRLPLSEGQEYWNSFGFSNIPAYSVTYHLDDAFSEMMSKDKGADFDGLAYYPFEFEVDPYRIEIEKRPNLPYSSIISDVLLQNAREHIYFNRDNFDPSINKLGTFTNKSNQYIQYEGFVVLADGTVFDISNYIPTHNEVFEVVTGYYCEMDTSDFKTEEDYKKNCQAIYEEVEGNSIYVDVYAPDEVSSISYFDIYVNAWYIDEKEENKNEK